MNSRDKFRQQKLAEAILPFFNRLSSENGRDGQAMLVCRHLLSLNDKAIEDIHLDPFLKVWASNHPEEEVLNNGELLRALRSVRNTLLTRVEDNPKSCDSTNSQQVHLRVIQGGLSKNPDIPFVDMEQVVHEIEL